jgi:hypothetical protein
MIRARAAAWVFTIAPAVLLMASSPAAARRPPSYHSPGYKGTTRLPHVTATPFPPTVLGTGKYPDVLVDAAGTGHVTFSEDGGSSSPDTISYCRLLRGQKGCSSTTSSLAPVAPTGGQSDPYIGNFPGGNHDFDGAVPLAIGNQLFLVDRRFPDTFPTPDMSTSESNVFLWSSEDGGGSFTGPGTIGDNEMGGGAIAYGGAASPSIGTISRTQTGGTFFQGVPAGQYTTAKAQLGTPAQAYDGGAATDGTRPAAVFDDTAGNSFVREWSGNGDINDAANWSEASFRGSSPRIAAGARGVFVLYRDSLVGGNVLVRRIAGGQPAGNPIRLAGAAGVTETTISEDASGALAAEWIDGAGIELRSSTDGTHWSAAQLVAKAPAGSSLSHLALAATADGGGFSAYVANASGAEGVGRVETSAFGTQRGTGKPGLGQLPGGGIGTPTGDQLATSTCTTAKFGVVTAQIKAGCFLHDPQEPSLDVSLGEIDLNGLRIIPDAGVRIGVDPKFHTIDTTGSVSVVLSGPGIDVTIWHGELHVKLPLAQPGTDLFDFSELTAPLVAGFPISGDVDVKLIDGGVQVPVSLKLPGYFGGITGSATLEATLNGGLALDSLEFKVGDANIGALELKDVDISYTRQGNVWKGTGTVNVPAGGRLVELTLAIEFDNGAFRSGRFEVGLPYPGVPLDLNDTPPQLYLKKGGLGLGLSPVSLSGSVGLGISPLYADLSDRDYAFSLDGGLSFAFGDPVAITVTAKGFLRQIQIAQAKLVYSLPDSVSLTGTSGYDLGIVKEQGLLSAIVDPRTKTYGARMSGDTTIDLSQVGIPSPDPSLLGKGTITISSGSLAINNDGFGVYFPFPAAPVPLSVTYRWGDSAPQITFFKDVTSQFTAGVPAPASDGRRAHAAAVNTFQVPAGTAALDVEATGAPGAPAVVLQTPSGSQIVPSTTLSRGEQAIAIADPRNGVTHIGLDHPQAGRWTVQQAPGSQVPVTGVRYALAQAEPVVKATVGGRGRARSLRYRVSLPPNVSVTFAEQTRSLLHIIGRPRGRSGTIRFTPALGRGGQRQVIALIDNAGLPLSRPVLASFVAPGPQLPGRARKLRIGTGGRAFTITFSAPSNAVRTLVVISTTDGRRLQRLLPIGVHRFSVPVIGYRDGIRVQLSGVSATGRRGPAVSASGRRSR